MDKDYDFLVIGGGSGGLAAARRAAAHGARTALIEAGAIGGTCVNVGCVPKKVMWNTAGIAEVLRDARDYGFDVDYRGFDWGTIKRARDAYIERLHAIYYRNLEAAPVARIDGWARFVDPHTVAVGGDRYRAGHVLIATGGRPEIPQVPGAGLGISSDGFFDLETQPRRVVIVGAGYVAVELAGVLNALGSEVTLLLRREVFLRSFDATLRETLMDEMQANGVNILTCIHLERVERAADGRLALSRAPRARRSPASTR